MAADLSKSEGTTRSMQRAGTRVGVTPMLHAMPSTLWSGSACPHTPSFHHSLLYILDASASRCGRSPREPCFSLTPDPCSSAWDTQPVSSLTPTNSTEPATVSTSSRKASGSPPPTSELHTPYLCPWVSCANFYHFYLPYYITVTRLCLSCPKLGPHLGQALYLFHLCTPVPCTGYVVLDQWLRKEEWTGDLRTNTGVLICCRQDTVSDVYLIFTKICKVGIIIQSHQMRKAKLVQQNTFL